MHQDRSHPLLAQVPLTVSPFISLPTAPSLPYTYKTLPSTLPPSSTNPSSSSFSSAAGANPESSNNAKPKYIVSSTGHAAHPSDIIASCQTLQSHLSKQQADADKALADWESSIQERELAEKRRVAPGWLDRDEKILEPARASHPAAELDEAAADTSRGAPAGAQQSSADDDDAMGRELDRAFGGMNVR